jgi:co-chaperonin GroES (HSP10)
MRRAKTGGGIVIPGNVADPQAYGKVLSVGEDAANKSIKEGDIIVCHLNAGMDMVMERNLMRTLKYDEIYGVLKDKDFEKNLEEMVITGSSESIIKTTSKPQLIHPVS